MNQLLSSHDLNTAHFSLLNHLARHADHPQTLSDLTAAMELNQPAVSKIINKFSKAGWVAVKKDQKDSRKKWVTITAAGNQLVGDVMRNIGPDVAQWFLGWEEEDIKQFGAHMQKLAAWLDDNRLV
ncbi:MAG: MarR family winged helix-turn-helix transcriptional regulator [Anaerolineae bacterium]